MPLKVQNLPSLGSTPPTSDIIAKYIREAIITGGLDENEPIRQDDIARLFDVSKIPVREALKRLEAEGLVEFQRNRGAVVTSVTEPEIAEIFEVRGMLEANALRLSIPRMTDRTFQLAEEYCDAFARETDVARWAELNWQFHSCLYEDANKPFLLNLIRSVNDRIERYLRIQLTLSGGTGVDDREHRQILAACRGRNIDLASELLVKHITKACESLLSNLPKIRGPKQLI
ncbi:GntR family transcriptional regulator [Phyllobacterium sophorae]|uniref:GntR family transcriptional regulator n=1 Tax=Phyllobacterium sophorae TaxID=1520277 RepID=A0A2P7BGA8_9HYPH|nr:GntR family transcriptional regulator [Phyllobacterium sophorae]PSH65524.1 GntR family transcriptional regulator [Phyllobacterium sophorae]